MDEITRKIPCSQCIHSEVCHYKDEYNKVSNDLMNLFQEFQEKNCVSVFDFQFPTCKFVNHGVQIKTPFSISDDSDNI